MKEMIPFQMCCNAVTIGLHCIRMHMFFKRFMCNAKCKGVFQGGMSYLFHKSLRLNYFMCGGLTSWDHFLVLSGTTLIGLASLMTLLGPIRQLSIPLLACPPTN
ncbi:hypothetical protein MTR67_040013 [Solanum verrucosum]|uniref:Uncharacterized protein n=1 Tax=Solanum verrucosum TaxID=315347 RepID=A0AAF0UHV6_SOLVR|nr:hypothetical protein MTR67_040013 [Solanum verrucosum]